MKLQFKIDKAYLLARAMEYYSFENKKPFHEWRNLEQSIWEEHKDKIGYYLLKKKHLSWAIENIWIGAAAKKVHLRKFFSDAVEEAEMIQGELFKYPEFKRLYSETQKYFATVTKQWTRNKTQALSLVQQLSGISLPSSTITVFIVHPKLERGRAYVKYNAIAWGHEEEWQNYNTVYLCHEIMHFLTKKDSKNDAFIMHSLIELMIDNELRIRLNGKGKYFKENGRIVGHPDLQELNKKILPLWKSFLTKQQRKNIFELEKVIIEKGIANT